MLNLVALLLFFLMPFKTCKMIPFTTNSTLPLSWRRKKVQFNLHIDSHFKGKYNHSLSIIIAGFSRMVIPLFCYWKLQVIMKERQILQFYKHTRLNLYCLQMESIPMGYWQLHSIQTFLCKIHHQHLMHSHAY